MNPVSEQSVSRYEHWCASVSIGYGLPEGHRCAHKSSSSHDLTTRSPGRGKSTNPDRFTLFETSNLEREITMFFKETVAIFLTALALVISLPANAGKPMGERCIRDGECDSGECKKLQCTIRIKPKGQIGDRCVFDGDCASDECKKLRCVPNEHKQRK